MSQNPFANNRQNNQQYQNNQYPNYNPQQPSNYPNLYNNGQNPYNQGQGYNNPYNQQPYGQNPYGQNPYGNNPYQQQVPNRFQGNEMGKNFKNNKKNFSFIKILIILLLIGGLLGGGYFAYKTFIAKQGHDLSEELAIALSHKMNNVSNSGNQDQIDFMYTYLSVYLGIMAGPEDGELGINNAINIINQKIAVGLQEIESLDGEAKQAKINELNSLIAGTIEILPEEKQNLLNFLTLVAPQMKPQSPAEEAALEYLKQGVQAYADFIILYDMYLKNPTNENLQAANNKQEESVLLLTNSLIEYATDLPE